MSIRLSQIELSNLKWYVRPNSSDIKSLHEVVTKHSYEKHGIELNSGDRWIDLGANIGAFTVLAASKGCEVIAYEPDPVSYQITVENLKLNGLRAEVINAAVTHTTTTYAQFYQNTARQNYWRNSLVKQWRGGKTIKVRTLNYRDCLHTGANIKMDIEGSEMPILEALDLSKTGDLVYEWSFDIDRSIARFKRVIERARTHFTEIRYSGFDETAEQWQPSWYPPCRTVHCRK